MTKGNFLKPYVAPHVERVVVSTECGFEVTGNNTEQFQQDEFDL